MNTLNTSAPPRGDPWAVNHLPPCGTHWQANCEFVSVYMSTGRRLMASLGACQARTHAEDLQSSQGESSILSIEQPECEVPRFGCWHPGICGHYWT